MNDFITNAMTAKSDRPNQKKRQRLSVKKNCLSRISFTQDGSYLKCIRIYDIHNHDRDLSLFMASSRQRQLDDDQKTIIHQALKYDGNLTLIHQEMKKKFFIITKRDLYNLKHKYMKNPCSINDLEDLIKTIKLDELPIDLMMLCFQELREACEKVCNLEYLKTKKRINILENKENIINLPSCSNSLELIKTLQMPQKINRKKKKMQLTIFNKKKALNKEIDTDIDLFLEQDITNQNLQELPIEALIQIPKTLSFQKLFSK
ncbi:unnamed protein product [Gordionus sp. m RMFG-2023]